MNNAVFNLEDPKNEVVLNYEKNSHERKELFSELQRQSNLQIEIPLIIGGNGVRNGKRAATSSCCSGQAGRETINFAHTPAIEDK